MGVSRKWRRRLAFGLVGGNGGRNSDAEIRSDIRRRRGCDAQRHSRSRRYAIAGSLPAAGYTEVPDIRRPAAAVALAAVRMDDGWQAMDSAAATPTRPVKGVTRLLMARDSR
jgi:hypothetical protein